MGKMRKIFLYGAPASGKTTLGGRLAEALKTGFTDLDAVIADRAGMSIPEIFATEGEAGFRERESGALAEIAAADADSVVALGGGALLRDSNRRLCEEKGEVWCLDAPSDAELVRRLGAAPGERPLGDRAAERASHYASFSNRVAAYFETEGSLILVGRTIASPVLSRYPVVADAAVAALARTPIAAIPSGEKHKNLPTVCGLWKAFAEKGLGRRDAVCSLGGGVTGDLTGFAAATWMRGIDWVNGPTTLLAMVDASTGGKTGFDLPEGKNLAGAFHVPRLVVIDTDFLRTLPPDILAAGKAEMIKHEIIGGKEGKTGAGIPTAEEIAENLAVKVDLVREDPFDTKGRRMLLNCGHTVAHAVEKLTDYRIPHGEAVAIGCVEEARMAVRLGLAEPSWPGELEAVFSAAGLATALPDGIDFEKMKPVMRGDKKRSGDVVTFALPCGRGDVRPVPVDLS